MATILIADGNAVVRQVVREFLEACAEDYRVFEASVGLEALDMAREEEPDSILLDLRLPFINGIETAARLRALGIDSRIVLCTSYNALALSEEARAAGVDYVLAKPFNLRELQDRLTGIH